MLLLLAAGAHRCTPTAPHLTCHHKTQLKEMLRVSTEVRVSSKTLRRVSRILLWALPSPVSHKVNQTRHLLHHPLFRHSLPLGPNTLTSTLPGDTQLP